MQVLRDRVVAAVSTAASDLFGPARVIEAQLDADATDVSLYAVIDVVDRVAVPGREVAHADVAHQGFELGDQMLVQLFFLAGDEASAEAQDQAMGAALARDASLDRATAAWRERYLQVVTDALRPRPQITSDTVIMFRTADLDRSGLDLVTPARLPPDAGPHGCLFFISAATLSARMFAAIPECDIDHVADGMAIAAEVMSKVEGLLDLSAFNGAASVGFHASPAEDVEHWLRSQEDMLVMPLATLLVAIDRPQLDDYVYGKFAFDRLVRGDAELGLLADVPAYIGTMMAALWRAAAAGDPRAFAVLGECYVAVLVPCGAFDGAPTPEDAPPFSAVTMQIIDEELPPLSFALRCWYEAAVRGDRDALLRFATISRTGPERAKQLALELLTRLDAPSSRQDAPAVWTSGLHPRGRWWRPMGPTRRPAHGHPAGGEVVRWCPTPTRSTVHT